MGLGGLAKPVKRIEVGLQRRIEILGRDLRHRLAELLVTGVDDQDVQAAENLHHPRDHGRIPRFVPDVSGQGQGLHPGLLDQGDHLCGVRLLGRQIADGDICAFARIGDGGRPADAGIPARDQGPASFQTAMSDIAVLAMVGPRDHPAGQAGFSLRLTWKGRSGILVARILHGQAIGHGSSSLWRLSRPGAAQGMPI
ncbi:hypothetical protein D3C71_306840 [compost metagenome]